MRTIGLVSIVIIGLQSCTSEEPSSTEIELDLPETLYEYVGNSEQATLGRVLFYDPQLSINNSISCASCHKQAAAFSDIAQFSRGFDNRATERNSMPIQNVGSVFNFFSLAEDTISQALQNDFFPGVSSSGLFWDGRGTDHSRSVLLPIINHIEMGIPDMDYLTTKLSSISYYPELFAEAFPNQEITPQNIGFALNQFISNIQSNNTRFDRWTLDGEQVLSSKERLGKDLFFNTYDCNSCHQVQSPDGYLFAGTFANIGLELNYEDSGLENTTTNAFDNGKFKIPSLRNVTLTGPYMHDGRFSTLEEVVGHYSSGLENNENLDSRLRDENGNPIRFEITDHEVSAIVAFLGTLTDHDMITDERLSNPFKVK